MYLERWKCTVDESYPIIISDSEYQSPSPIVVNLPQLLRKYHQPTMLSTTLATSLQYTCTPSHWHRSLITWRCRRSLLVQTWRRTNVVSSALKIYAVVVCDWPDHAEAMPIFYQIYHTPCYHRSSTSSTPSTPSTPSLSRYSRRSFHVDSARTIYAVGGNFESPRAAEALAKILNCPTSWSSPHLFA